jgi:hypothetical protein
MERFYARGVYPSIAKALACVSAMFSFPLAELLLALFVTLLIVVAFRAATRLRATGSRRAVLVQAARSVLVSAGVAYSLFLLLWGFNYRRPPLAALSGLEVRPAPRAELEELTRALVLDANGLRVGLPETAAGVFRLEAGFEAALRSAPTGLRAAAASYPTLGPVEMAPKAALMSPFLSRVGVSGIYIPFTAEPLVNAMLPEAEVPFSASHELAHSRGIAREDEANFVAYVACRAHPDPAFRYSGALEAGFYSGAALASADPEAADRLLALRSEAVRRDVAAIQAWVARYRGPLMDAGERVNNAYLKAQGQLEGVRSYGRMLDLLLAERRARERVLGSAR